MYSLLNHDWVKTKNHETRPTYLYEDLMNGIPLNNSLNIEWVNEDLVADKCEISNGCRLNVPAYIKDESSHYINFFRKDINHSTSYIQERDTRSVTDLGDSIRNNYNKYIYDTRRI